MMEMRAELFFFASFPKELEQFRGKHVATIGIKVVAIGDSAKEVFEKARKEYPEKMPVLAFIPKKEALVLQVFRLEELESPYWIPMLF
jgi:lysine/ornithine N-monooxygenase